MAAPLFDGRRWNVGKSTEKVDRSDGEDYRHRSHRFDPKYENERDDFEAPIRMFMEPVFEP